MEETHEGEGRVITVQATQDLTIHTETVKCNAFATRERQKYLLDAQYMAGHQRPLWRGGGEQMALSLGSVPTVALSFVLIAAIFVAGFLVLDGLSSDLEADSYGANATDTMSVAMENVIDFAATWGTIIGVSVLLGIVMIGFGMARSGGYI